MPEARSADASERSSPLILAAAALFLIVAAILAWQGLGLFKQDLKFTAVETEISFWGRGQYVPDLQTREWVGRELEYLLDREPKHPGYLTLAASYHSWQAYWAETAELELDYNTLAEQAKQGAWRSRPAHPSNSPKRVD